MFCPGGGGASFIADLPNQTLLKRVLSYKGKETRGERDREEKTQREREEEGRKEKRRKLVPITIEQKSRPTQTLRKTKDEAYRSLLVGELGLQEVSQACRTEQEREEKECVPFDPLAWVVLRACEVK